MTSNEIYSAIANQMIKGIMLHSELADYYKFLGLDGYSKCHEYYYYKESKCYKKFCNYVISHSNKLIPDTRLDYNSIIPENWYNYSRDEVDTATKQGAIKFALTSWVDWETQTKELYQQMYKELMNIDEIASAMYISKLVCEVDEELSKAIKYHINKKAMNYSLTDIVSEQKSCKHSYCEKIEKLKYGHSDNKR